MRGAAQAWPAKYELRNPPYEPESGTNPAGGTQPMSVNPYRSTSSGTQSMNIVEPYRAAVSPIV